MNKRALKNFWEAHIENLPSEHEPLLTTMLFQHGCAGTTQKLDFSQPGLMYEPVVEEKDTIHLICYFDLAQKESVAPLLQDWIWKNSPETGVQWVMQKERDWLTEWKKNFKPFTLAGLRVTPSWRVTKKNKSMVILDPGMAFGTGHHATTKFAIQQLEFLKKKKQLQKKQVLDVGAGSGILCVVAEKYGAGSMTANDNDPQCWKESSKTFRLNKTKKCRVTKTQIQDIKKSYDVVIANIIDGVLLNLKDQLWRVTKKNGYLVLSGILAENAQNFIAGFCEGQDSEVIQSLTDGEWTSFLVRKK